MVAANRAKLADPLTQAYCLQDVTLNRKLYDWLADPEPNVNDYAAMAVAYSWYHGFLVDKDLAEKSRLERVKICSDAENYLNQLTGDTGVVQSSKKRLKLLRKYFPLLSGTGKKVLEKVQNNSEFEELFLADQDPARSAEGKLILRHIVAYGSAHQQLKQIEKMQESKTGRLHTLLKIIGSRTNRMSGDKGFNIQGVGRGSGLRGIICDLITVMDFFNLELCILAEVAKDERMTADLMSGKDMHSQSCKWMFFADDDEMTYDMIIAIKKDHEHPRHDEIIKLRSDAKSANFAISYGGTYMAVMRITGCSEAQAVTFIEKFRGFYTGIAKFFDTVEARFNTSDVATGWKTKAAETMDDKVTDIFGFTRYFTTEKTFAVYLRNAKDVIKEAAKIGGGKIVLRSEQKGKQRIEQALNSAMLGATNKIGAKVYKQAGNHMIQAVGARLTKMLMVRLHRKFNVCLLNIHDELVIAKKDGVTYEMIAAEVKLFVDKYRQLIPCLKMNIAPAETWAEK
jgi:DNA polymerase I-like protein with 3'-5' exonuclease and polymerase domains